MNAKQPVDFQHGDDLSDMLGSGARVTPAPAAPEYERIRQEVPTFSENCPKCHGTGRFTSYAGRSLGQCFACKGKGKNVYKSSPQERAQGRQNYQKAKVNAATSKWDDFVARQPLVAEWVLGNLSFGLATSIKTGVEKYGNPTDNMLNAALKLIARKAEPQVVTPARAALALPNIQASFDLAVSKGAKRASLRCADIVLSLAPATGKNPGAIYVKRGSEYAGKVIGGVFQPVRSCPVGTDTLLAEFEVDPAAAAVRFGIATGTCCCCGAELSDPESIKAGIGPVCATKHGF